MWLSPEADAPGHRKGGWDRDARQSSLRAPAMFSDAQRQDLRGVDGAASAEADDAIRIGLLGVVDRGLDLMKRRMLADDDGDRRIGGGPQREPHDLFHE